MLRFVKIFLVALFAVAALTALNAGPACADHGTLAAAQVAAAAPAPEQPGCQPSLDLGAVLDAKAQTCPAAPQEQIGTPDFIVTGGRTCKCSCGYPCQTDADCGGAVGSCRAGITCC
ncbi:MAG TPA: hypothetical protein VHC97_23210 [Thermoanaerobaculia bacterium]|jgi:hypothetical protein|nr:hypothetical protein [Thermoanaerobaculia bacterium]